MKLWNGFRPACAKSSNCAWLAMKSKRLPNWSGAPNAPWNAFCKRAANSSANSLRRLKPMPSAVLGWNNPLELEERVEAFESAWNQAGSANPVDFLPPSDHPSYRAILCELVRVDLELHWTHRQFKRVEDYLRDFPILRHDPDLLQQIAFEEYRQR